MALGLRLQKLSLGTPCVVDRAFAIASALSVDLNFVLQIALRVVR